MLALVGLSLLLAALGMSPALQARIADWARQGAETVQAFAGLAQGEAQVTLPAQTLYGVQLAAFASGERAESERQALAAQGVPCVIWQRETMRVICAVACTREALDEQAAGGREAYVVTDALPEVRLTLGGTQADVTRAVSLLRLPDALLANLLEDAGTPLAQLVAETRAQAQRELATPAQQEVYGELAQSLVNWCALMEDAQEGMPADAARRYGQLTMALLCRELRVALQRQPDASSTASAQRTPSTAAEVIPPA